MGRTNLLSLMGSDRPVVDLTPPGQVQALLAQVAALEDRLASLERRLGASAGVGLTPDRMVGLARQIIVATANHYGVNASDLTGLRRVNRISWPRHVAVALCRERSSLSYTELAQLFNREQSSIGHALATVRDRCETDTAAYQQVEALRRSL